MSVSMPHAVWCAYLKDRSELTIDELMARVALLQIDLVNRIEERLERIEGKLAVLDRVMPMTVEPAEGEAAP